MKTRSNSGFFYIIVGVIIIVFTAFTIKDGVIMQRLTSITSESNPFVFYVQIVFSMGIGLLSFLVGLAKIFGSSKLD